MGPQKGKSGKSKIWLFMFFLFLVIVVFAAVILFRQYIGRQAGNRQFDSLQGSVNDTAYKNGGETAASHATEGNDRNGTGEDGGENGIPGTSGTGTPEGEAPGMKTSGRGTSGMEASGVEIPEKNLDWDALHGKNADIYAWIYVTGTTVDYPVVQHPTDNSYYLDHNMDGSRGYPGCIYTEDFNGTDFSDIHTVIYGHNLKDRTMFSSLHNFEDEGLFWEDNYIFIYTEDDVFVYQVFAAYESGAIHLLDNYDYTNEYVYEDYLKRIYQTADRVANVRDDIRVTAEDKIITLSTCTEDHDADRRFLVTGVLLDQRGQGSNDR